jgi:hypothetical protein
MCSSKFFDDHTPNNSEWARVGGISVKEMNSLELTFLTLIDYSLYVTYVYLQTFNDLCNPLLHTPLTCRTTMEDDGKETTCQAALRVYGVHPSMPPIHPTPNMIASQIFER